MSQPVSRNKSKVVLFASSRSNGHTFDAVQSIFSAQKKPSPLITRVSELSSSASTEQNTDTAFIPVVDLSQLAISAYDYQNANQLDDFLPLMEKVLTYDVLIMATPVYWYSMSGVMKIFFDRLSDLLTIRKDLGRRMKGKSLYVIASYGTSMPSGFESVFSQTCDYLSIHYLGCSFIYSGHSDDLKILNQSQIIKANQILQLY